MKERNIFRMLTVTLAVAALVLVVVLVRLYRNVYYIPETAVTDLCAALAEDGISLSPSLVSRKREGGVIYMGSDNDADTAVRLTDSEIKNTFAVPEGMLYLHYNGDVTSFGSDFRIHYRRAGAAEHTYGADSSDTLFAVTDTEYDGYAAAARAFLEKGDGGLSRKGGGPSIETVIEGIQKDADGVVYVRCLRRIDGVEITENDMLCVIENGIVTEADGKWCFLTFGESYVTQVSDITNILYMMKRVVAAGGDSVPESIRVEDISRSYSLYFLPDAGNFCLIPCIRIETDTYGTLVFSQLDGTLYTRIGA